MFLAFKSFTVAVAFLTDTVYARKTHVTRASSFQPRLANGDAVFVKNRVSTDVQDGL
jgi:hypothetical protein